MSEIVQRRLLLWAFLAGTAVGIALLLLRAPLWTFYVAPLIEAPLLIAYLRPRHTDPRSARQLSEPVLFTVGGGLPEDPYVGLSHAESIYVITQPTDLERLRAQGVSRLGGTTAIVYERDGEPVVYREQPLLPKLLGWHVAVGQGSETRGPDSALFVQSAEGREPDPGQPIEQAKRTSNPAQ